MAVELKYRRILLKLSGEALGAQGTGIDAATVRSIATESQACACIRSTDSDGHWWWEYVAWR